MSLFWGFRGCQRPCNGPGRPRACRAETRLRSYPGRPRGGQCGVRAKPGALGSPPLSKRGPHDSPVTTSEAAVQAHCISFTALQLPREPENLAECLHFYSDKSRAQGPDRLKVSYAQRSYLMAPRWVTGWR